MGSPSKQPHSREAEQAVLGAILLTGGSALDDVVEIVQGEDFFEERHRLMWAGMLGLAALRSPIDLVTLSERLKAAGTLAEAGGAAYLSACADGAVSPANIRAHARVVRDRAMQRALHAAGQEIAASALGSREEPALLLDKAEARLSGIHRPGGREVTALADLLPDAFRRIEAAAASGRATIGVASGLPDLDRLLGGFEPGDLVIVGARPSMGKTGLLLGFLEAVSVDGRLPALLFSLEMGREQVTDRMLARRANVDLAAMRAGRLAQEGFGQIAAASGALHDAPLWIDDTPGITPLALRAKARRAARQHKGLALIAVDYVQLMHGDGESPEQRVSDCSQALKDLARELAVPVVLLSQLSRDVEKRSPPIPRPSDLRSSGSLEQDADKIVFIHRAAMYSEQARRDRPHDASLIVAKNRNGPAGVSCKVYFDAERASFRSADYGSEPGANWQEAGER
jgi:replicative DNA helicase